MKDLLKRAYESAKAETKGSLTIDDIARKLAEDPSVDTVALAATSFRNAIIKVISKEGWGALDNAEVFAEKFCKVCEPF